MSSISDTEDDDDCSLIIDLGDREIRFTKQEAGAIDLLVKRFMSDDAPLEIAHGTFDAMHEMTVCQIETTRTVQ